LNKYSSKIFVKDVMILKDKIPLVSEDEIVKKGIELMCNYNLGIVCVVASDNELLGVLTDGDLRRHLLKTQKPLSAFFVDDILDYVTKEPLFVNYDSSLFDAINLMEQKKIWDLPVIDKTNKILGLLHLHPAIKKLINND
jgi:DeoR family transcriptional regulator, catabolite repression regulator